MHSKMRPVWGAKKRCRLTPESDQNSERRESRSKTTKGRALPLCPACLNVDLFRYGEGIVHLNAEIPHSALYLCVTEQQLNGPLLVAPNSAKIANNSAAWLSE